MNPWFYHEAGQQRGPVSKDELLALFAGGKIDPDTLVWSQGMSEWQAARGVSELQLAIQPASPSPANTPVSPYAPPVSESNVAVAWDDYVPSGPQIRPWIRYWARTFDFIFFSILVGVVIGAVSPDLIEQIPEMLLGVLILVAYNFVEPALLTSFGTTPFKALFRVRVRNSDGSKPTYLQALRRTLSVWVFGQGLGLPFIALITSITSYSRLTNQHITRWDQAGDFTVSHQTVTWWRWLIALAGAVGFIWLMILGKQG